MRWRRRPGHPGLRPRSWSERVRFRMRRAKPRSAWLEYPDPVNTSVGVSSIPFSLSMDDRRIVVKVSVSGADWPDGVAVSWTGCDLRVEVQRSRPQPVPAMSDFTYGMTTRRIGPIDQPVSSATAESSEGMLTIQLLVGTPVLAPGAIPITRGPAPTSTAAPIGI